MKKLIQVVKKLFVNQHIFGAHFKILNPEILEKYHNSTGYFAEFVLTNNKPNGTWGFSGKDKEKIIITSYDNRAIQIDKIVNFLESYGLKVQLIKNEPFKRFMGIDYYSS